ncbi:MAG: hypothetical protein H6R17_2257 [Proteobacteria bacterium]|nr:hypothetical protein [Pseudomonadota bacterium]
MKHVPAKEAIYPMHHCYFDPDKLTDAQRARWNHAIAEYDKILNRNVERQIGRMSDHDKKNFLLSFPTFSAGDESIEEDVRQVLRLFYGMSGGAEGNPRSALLARLLDGKPPLRAPPPSTFHRPWYEVIEDDGPFEVIVSDAHLSCAPSDHGEHDATHSLCIDRCPWLVVHMNGAARRLFAMQQRLDGKARRERGGTAFGWTSALLSDVLAAYRDGPEFIVRHEEWPPYRLGLRRRESIGHPDLVIQDATAESLRRTETVFDTQALRLGHRVLGTEDGTKLRYEWQGWLLEKTQ